MCGNSTDSFRILVCWRLKNLDVTVVNEAQVTDTATKFGGGAKLVEGMKDRLGPKIHKLSNRLATPGYWLYGRQYATKRHGSRGSRVPVHRGREC